MFTNCDHHHRLPPIISTEPSLPIATIHIYIYISSLFMLSQLYCCTTEEALERTLVNEKDLRSNST